jgi:hypothetical protein
MCDGIGEYGFLWDGIQLINDVPVEKGKEFLKKFIIRESG